MVLFQKQPLIVNMQPRNANIKEAKSSLVRLVMNEAKNARHEIKCEQPGIFRKAITFTMISCVDLKASQYSVIS